MSDLASQRLRIERDGVSQAGFCITADQQRRETESPLSHLFPGREIEGNLFNDGFPSTSKRWSALGQVRGTDSQNPTQNLGTGLRSPTAGSACGDAIDYLL